MRVHTCPGRVTPAHPLVGTHVHIKCQGAPKKPRVSTHLGSESTEKRNGALGVGALCCWMSQTLADIHIDEGGGKSQCNSQNLIVMFLLQMAGNRGANISGYNHSSWIICVVFPFLLLLFGMNTLWSPDSFGVFFCLCWIQYYEGSLSYVLKCVNPVFPTLVWSIPWELE